MNARSRFLLLIVFLLMLCCPGKGLAAPVPALKADQETNWDTAWELAWATAWESCGQLAASSAPSPVEDALLQSTVNLYLDGQQSGVELVWGLDASFVSSLLSEARGVSRAASRHDAVTPGKLFVQIEPLDAQVEILNATQSFAQGMDLESGEYVLAFKRHGYETQTRRVEVLPGMAATVRVSLNQGEVAAAEGKNENKTLPARGSESSWDSLFKQLSLAPRPSSQREAKNKTAASSVSALVSSKAMAPQPAATHARQLPADQDAASALSQGAFAVGQVSSSGMLFVETKPAGATVRVMNIRPKFKQGMELASGTYRVQVSMPGFKSVERVVNIASGNTSRVVFSLEKAPSGRLFVETDAFGASVRIKNIRPKFSQGMELSEGKYMVEIVIPGRKPLLREVEVAAYQDNRLRVEIDGVNTGRLFVETEPTSAQVKVRGAQGVFSQGMELPVGKYAIEATCAEHKSKSAEIEIVAGADNRVQLSLERMELASKTQKTEIKLGRLFVQVDPQAVVRILRIKPKFVQGMELAAGRYTLAASRNGFKDTKKDVEVVAGRDTFIALPLIAKTGAQPGMATSPAASPVSPSAPVGETALAPQKEERQKFDVDSYVSMAIVAINTGDFSGAMEATKQALKLNPNAADAHKAMGDAYLLQEAYSEAVACYDRALAINPSDTRLRQNKNYAAEQVQVKGQSLKPKYGQAVIRDQGMSYQLGNPTAP